MKYKVSNVCQLLDKSKYNATTTRYGITFTNNGDGSWILNGTATAQDWFRISLNLDDNIYKAHKYLICGNTSTDLALYIQNSTGVGNFFFDYGYGGIYTATNTYTFSGWIRTNKGAIYDNVVIRPQLFDLTEMYGAGNEPTTIEEFRKDFPDDYYEYSPKCFEVIHKLHYVNEAGKYLSMNRGKYVTESKNLISIESLFNAGFTLKNGFLYYANTSMLNNKILWENTEGYTGDITFSCYGFAENPLSTGNIQFLVERNDGDLGYVAPIFKTNTLDYYSWTYRGYTTGIKNVKWINVTRRPIYITKIMLEKSKTATDYQPYNHIAFN